MPNNIAPDYNGLLKLFCLLVAKQGGEIRLSAADIHDTEPPKGYTKKWCNETKELVISVLDHGTAIYVTEDNQWTNQPARSPVESTSPAQLSAQVEEAWTGRPAAGSRPAPPSHIVLDEEKVAEIDSQRRMKAALDQILEFDNRPSHTPSSTRSSQPQPTATVRTELPRQYFKG